MIARNAIVSALAESLVAWTPARAAWLGGSDASGRTDQLSDIDLLIIVENGHARPCFGGIEDSLRELSPIAAELRLPQPTWHGHEQAFYQLRDTDPCHMIDVVVMERGGPADRFLELERHGEPCILFDHDGLVRPTTIDRDGHQARVAARFADLKARFPLFVPLVRKAAARGQVAEAVHFYHAMALRPLVDLARICHCPDRFDFGPRYLDRDVPADIGATLSRLSLPASIAEIERNLAECAAVFRQLVTEIEQATG